MRGLTSDDKKLWALAVPMIFSNITVPLLGLVDTAVIGHLDKAVYLSGVAVGAMATSFLFMLFNFLRMSTTGLTAQALGAGDQAAQMRALLQPVLLALLIGLVIMALREPLIALAMSITGGSADVLEQAQRFLHWRWLSAPASLINMALLGWLLGMQYVRASVILLIVNNGLNILLELWLVVEQQLGVPGAAIATVIAEYLTVLVGIALVLRVMQRRALPLRLLWHCGLGRLQQLLVLNRDMLLRSFLLQCCFGAVTVIGARLGAEVVAVNAVLLNFLIFTAFALDGFAYAVEISAGHAFGARDQQRLAQIWTAAVRQAGLVAAGFTLLYLLAGKAIIRELTSLPAIQRLADHYLPWLILLPLVAVWCYLLDGLFISATRGKDMRNSMLLATIGFFITATITVPLWGNHGLWAALTLFMVLRGVTLGGIWRRDRETRWIVE